jgi:WD40 repeat protein
LELVNNYYLTHDTKMMRAVRRNLPADYDLDNFSISPDHLHIVSCDDNDQIEIVDVKTGQLVRTIQDHKFVFGVIFSLDNSKIISGTNDGLQIWDIRTGRLLHALPTFRVDLIIRSYTTEIIASCGTAHIEVWNIITYKLLNTFNNVGNVTSMAFSPDNSKLASSYSFHVKIWDLMANKLLRELVGNNYEGVSCDTFSPDGLAMAAAVIVLSKYGMSQLANY